MRADILVFPGALITPLQCGVLAHSSLAFSHVGSMLFIPQTFEDGYSRLCVYHSGLIGLEPWICPSVRMPVQKSVAIFVCIAPDQTVYVTDSNKIYRVALEGAVENFCGGASSFIDGSGILLPAFPPSWVLSQEWNACSWWIKTASVPYHTVALLRQLQAITVKWALQKV